MIKKNLKKVASKNCIIVLGAKGNAYHKLSSLCNMLGFEYRDDADQNIDSADSKINKEIQSFNRSILSDYNLSFDSDESINFYDIPLDKFNSYKKKLKKIIVSQFGFKNNVLLNDSTVSLLLPLYIEVLQKLEYDVLAIIGYSVNNLKAISDKSFDSQNNERVISNYLLQSEHYTRKLNRLFVTYPDLIMDPQIVSSKIRDYYDLNKPLYNKDFPWVEDDGLDLRKNLEHKYINFKTEVLSDIVKLIEDQEQIPKSKYELLFDKIRIEFNNKTEFKYIISKNFVCPGFAKSGTTLLHSIFSKTNSYIGPKSKESNYFRLAKQNISYSSLFKKEEEFAGKVFFEFSPTYSSSKGSIARSNIAKRIKLKLPNSKILFTIRHPLYRAFSHYIHQLQSFSKYGAYAWRKENGNLHKGYFYTFEQALATSPTVNPSYYDLIKSYFDVFGPDNCMFFYLETDGRSFADFYSNINNAFKLDVDNDWIDKEVPHVHQGSKMPQYFYGGTGGSKIKFSDNKDLLLPAGNLYIANDKRGHEIIPNVDKYLGNSLLNGQKYWTKELSRDHCENLYKEYIEQDFLKFLDLIKSSKFMWNVPDYINMPFKDKAIESVKPDYEFLVEKLN